MQDWFAIYKWRGFGFTAGTGVMYWSEDFYCITVLKRYVFSLNILTSFLLSQHFLYFHFVLLHLKQVNIHVPMKRIIQSTYVHHLDWDLHNLNSLETPTAASYCSASIDTCLPSVDPLLKALNLSIDHKPAHLFSRCCSSIWIPVRETTVFWHAR